MAWPRHLREQTFQKGQENPRAFSKKVTWLNRAISSRGRPALLPTEIMKGTENTV
jgi:hypothetical protein